MPLPKNVRFYHGTSDEYLGGFYQNGSVSKNDAYMFLENIYLVLTFPVKLRMKETNEIVRRDNYRLPMKDYNVFSDGPIVLNNEVTIDRILSFNNTPRQVAFCDQVRQRDRGCVLTGLMIPEDFEDYWTGLAAAHVFPLASESVFASENFDRYITNYHHQSTMNAPINSCQNGLLMDYTLHQEFDLFKIGINPDNNYKITHFAWDRHRIDGRQLSPACRIIGDPDAVSPQLLQWHFRQCVLKNMRAAAEPIWEHDFPPGSDMIGKIQSGPRPNVRMELELFSRLHGFKQEESSDEDENDLAMELKSFQRLEC